MLDYDDSILPLCLVGGNKSLATNKIFRHFMMSKSCWILIWETTGLSDSPWHWDIMKLNKNFISLACCSDEKTLSAELNHMGCRCSGRDFTSCPPPYYFNKSLWHTPKTKAAWLFCYKIGFYCRLIQMARLWPKSSYTS